MTDIDRIEHSFLSLTDAMGFHELAEGQTALRATISLLKDREDNPIGPTQFTVVAGTVTSTEFVIPLTEKNTGSLYSDTALRKSFVC